VTLFLEIKLEKELKMLTFVFCLVSIFFVKVFFESVI